METDVHGDYSEDIHEDYSDGVPKDLGDNDSDSIYNNLDFISNSTVVTLVSIFCLIVTGFIIKGTFIYKKCSDVGATEGCVSLSLLYWLKMLGIFLAVLLTLALMTLVTCRRPRKRADIEVSNRDPKTIL